MLQSLAPDLPQSLVLPLPQFLVLALLQFLVPVFFSVFIHISFLRLDLPLGSRVDISMCRCVSFLRGRPCQHFPPRRISRAWGAYILV